MAKFNLKKKSNISNLIDNKDFINLFDNELFEYILNTSENIKEGYIALKKLYFKDITTFNGYKMNFSENGFIKYYHRGRFVWSEEYRNYKKGSAFRGKKREEHSELMKVKMKGIDRGDSFREKKKQQNQSINFKIKFLKNKNIEIDYDNQGLVKRVYGKYISDVRKSAEYKINKIKKFILNQKYVGIDIYDEYVEKYKRLKLTKENYHEPFTQMMSMISVINISVNENMGTTKFFKKGEVNVKYCINKDIITYRSSWELDTINFLELNKITYKYEPFYLKKSDGTYYLPDFLIFIKKDVYLLEVKGFINGEEGLKNEKLKIDAGIKYCNKNNYKYVYLEDKLIDLKQIKENIKN